MRLTRVATARALAAALCLGLVAAPIAGAAPREGCPGLRKGQFWHTVQAPPWPSGPEEIAAYSVDSRNPQRILVTNGEAVMATVDEGCSWTESFTVPLSPSGGYEFSSATASIVALERALAAPNIVLALLAETGPLGRPFVIRSEDGGESWAPAGSGLPPAGVPEALRIAPSNPSRAYLGLDLGTGTIDTVFVSSDGGASWSPGSTPSAGEPGAVSGLAIDPIVPDDLWAYGPGGVFHSTDAAATFTPIDEFATESVNAMAVWRESGADPATVTAFRPGRDDFMGSPDGGGEWLRFGAPPGVQSVASGALSLEMVVAATKDVYTYHPASFAWIPLDAPAADVIDVQAGRTATRSFFGRTASTIELFLGAEAGSTGTSGEPVFDLPDLQEPPDVPPTGEPRLAPTGQRIVLNIGEERTIDYSLKLPENRTPLDVYLLIDTSDSMSGLINGLRIGLADLINELHEARIDVQFGVGEYRAYPDSQVPRLNEPNFVYRRVRDIGPYSTSLPSALQTLAAGAGGRFESHLPALLHSASGTYEDVYPPGPSPSDVPAGQQANFRAKALRVVIHATDSEFGRQEEDREFDVSDFGRLSSPDYPSFSEVAAALNAKGIMQVGLGVGAPKHPPRNKYLRGDFPTTMGDLRDMAARTGALAPAGGVDCETDGVVDVLAGQPLACPLPKEGLDNGGSLVPAIVNLVKAVRDYAQVSIVPSRGRAVVSSITPNHFSDIVLQETGGLDFQVTYSCPPDLAGQSVPVTLEANAGGFARLASATTTVVCQTTSTLFANPAIPILALIPITGPPPPPVTSSAPAPQAQAQAQFGLVNQKQQQPQLAFVQASNRELAQALAEEDTYEMSALSRDRRGVPPELTLGAGGVLLAFMYAAMVMAKEQVAKADGLGRTPKRKAGRR